MNPSEEKDKIEKALKNAPLIVDVEDITVPPSENMEHPVPIDEPLGPPVERGTDEGTDEGMEEDEIDPIEELDSMHHEIEDEAKRIMKSIGKRVTLIEIVKLGSQRTEVKIHPAFATGIIKLGALFDKLFTDLFIQGKIKTDLKIVEFLSGGTEPEIIIEDILDDEEALEKIRDAVFDRVLDSEEKREELKKRIAEKEKEEAKK